ncbi:MAG: sulfotransferase domain-containing protein [bacterium]|nr:sulfotransferase domain-containing protein [bacterium]
MSILIRKGRNAARRLAVFSKRFSRRPLRGLLSPFTAEAGRPLIVHCGHHKIGTLWFHNVLRAVADHYGLRYQKDRQPALSRDTDIFHQAHSNFTFDGIANYRGSHIVRDLRDVVISGYFYHLWTPEQWAHRVEDRWQGKSYQELLRSLDQQAGLLLEIDRFAEMNLQNFTDWNYADPNIVEVRYEELLADEAQGFQRIFRKYGFRPDTTEKATQLALAFSFSRIAKRKVGTVREGSHLRSGRPGEWQTLFDAKHRAHFKERIGPALIELGYERDNDW